MSVGARNRTHVRQVPDVRRRDALRPGVISMLLALVGVPLIALGMLIYQDLSEANAQREAVRDIVPVTDVRLRTLDLRAALSDERTWSIAALGVERFGVDPDLVFDVIGVDIEDRYVTSRAITDGLATGFPGIADDLAQLRANRVSNLQVAEGYKALMSETHAIGADAAQRLQQLALTRNDGDELLRALRVTEAAADAQLAVNGQFVSSISSRFVESTGAPEVELQLLVEQRRAYELANDDIDQNINRGPLAEHVEAIRESKSEATLLTSVELQISNALRAGLKPAEGDLFVEAIGDLEELQGFLLAAEASSQAWIALTREAGEEMVRVAEHLEGVSERQINESRFLIIATGFIALLGTAFVSSLLSRSLRRLARAAQALRDGDGEPVKPSGPLEVYLAGVALSEAASNFHLVRRQATVLAAGDLGHPDLQRTAPGQLGTTLKKVVDTLSNSIHERELAQSEVVWEASHDGLTGLLNRTAAMEHLAAVLRDSDNKRAAVIVVDLDGFKAVNDGHGHPSGDEVLVKVADRLQGFCRDIDEVCRLGGDEFAMILAGPMSVRAAEAVARRALAGLGAPMELSGGALVSVRGSMGIALSTPDSTVSGLLKNADLAVYEAKGAGRNQVVTCTSELIEASRRAAELSADMLDAIERDEFRLEYQPIVDLGGDVVAVEALIRWDHPTHGLIMPDDFIPIAERSDLIIAVDRWVVRSAVEQLSRWAEFEQLVVAVNISTRHLSGETVVNDVLGPLRQFDVDPRRLGIEITETALVQNTDDARRTLESLRTLGVQIAIDDFGTGYSGITQLRTLPIDLIKIDRSFTPQITDTGGHDSTLVQLIIETAHLLGAQVIIEGVESIEQAETAIRMGANALQGWLYSASVPPEDVTEMLEAVRARFRRPDLSMN